MAKRTTLCWLRLLMGVLVLATGKAIPTMAPSAKAGRMAVG
jgi:hypothetical protein